MKLLTESLVYNKNKFYFITRELNILFEYDIKRSVLKSIGSVPSEDKADNRLFNGLCVLKNKLVFAPFNAENICIYDLNLNKWDCVGIDKYVSQNVNGKFVGCVGYKNYVYFFGYQYSGILQLNIDTYEIKIISGISEFEDYFWGQSTAVIDNIVYVANRVKNEVLALNMEDGTYKKHKFTINQEKHGGIANYNNKFILLPHQGNIIYEWDGDKKTKEIVLPEKYNTGSSIFNGLALSSSHAFLYSPVEGKSYIYGFNSQISREIDAAVFYVTYIPQIGFVVCKNGEIAIVDENLKKTMSITLEISKIEFEQYISQTKVKNKIYKENAFWGINEFIKII